MNQFIPSDCHLLAQRISLGLKLIPLMSLSLCFAFLAFLSSPASPSHADDFLIACGDTTSFVQAMTNARSGDLHFIKLNADNIPNCTYTFTTAAWSDATYGNSALPAIRRRVTIDGNGATLRRESAANFRFFMVDTEGGDLRLFNITLQNGAEQWGGAILVRQRLSLTNSFVLSNTAFERGGGLYFERINRRYISRTLIMGNLVSSPFFSNTMGGGIYSESEPLGLYHSTLFNNRAESRHGGESRGGGIYNDGNLDVINSTISDNHAEVASGEIGKAAGGGIFLTKVNDSGTAKVWFYNSTATNNTAFGNDGPNAGRGGGVVRDAGLGYPQIDQIFFLRNSLIAANNADVADDVWGEFTSYGYNLIGTLDPIYAAVDESYISGSHGNQWGSLANPIDPKLAPLADNGGATWTHALLPGSPAIDAANPTAPTISSVDPPGILPCELHDQRDLPRSFFPYNRCDLGAVEMQPMQTLAVTNPGNLTNLVGDVVSLQINVINPNNQPITFSITGLPTGLSVDPASGLISGIPTTTGVSNVSITVSDGLASDSTAFTWTINDIPNNPPTLTNPGNQTSTVGDSVNLPLVANDVDGDSLSFTATGLPDGLGVDAGSGVIVGIPTIAGTFNVTVIVSDGSDTGMATFTWSIDGPAGGCGPLSQEAEAASLNGAFITVNDGLASGGQYIEVPNGTGNDTVGGPNYAQFCFNVTTAGTYKILGSVWAPNGGSNSFYATINGAPATGYKWVMPPNSGFTSTYLNHNGTDIEMTLPTGEHTIIIYLREDGTRLDRLSLELVGGGGLNQSPVLSNPGNQASTVGDVINFTLTASDPDNDPLTFSDTGLPDGLTLNANTGILTGALTTIGTYNVTISVDDGQGNADTVSFVWTVNEVVVGTCDPLSQEAEAAIIGGAFVTVNDASASGGQYIEVPNGTGNSSIGSPSRVEFCFDVPTAGSYKLMGSVLAPNSGSNSFFVTIDDLPTAGHKWGIPTSITFTDVYVTHNGGDVIVDLSPGDHTVTVFLREDGTKLDKLTLELQ